MMLQVMQHGDDASKLANTTVQSIINAYNAEPGNRLTTAQAQAAETLQPGLARAQQAGTEHAELTNALLRSTNPITAATARLKLQQEQALGTLPVELLRAQITAAQNKDQRVMDIDTGTKDSAGKPVIIKNVSVDLAAEIYSRMVSSGLTQQNEIANKRNAEADTVARRKRAEDAELSLLGQVSKTDTTPALNHPSSQPYMDAFNEASDAPYAYVWDEGEKIPSTGVYKAVPGFIQSNNIPPKGYKVPLPIAIKDGKLKQLTARDMYEIGQKARPQQTVKQAIEILQRNNIIKGKFPWQP